MLLLGGGTRKNGQGRAGEWRARGGGEEEIHSVQCIGVLSVYVAPSTSILPLSSHLIPFHLSCVMLKSMCCVLIYYFDILRGVMPLCALWVTIISISTDWLVNRY